MKMCHNYKPNSSSPKQTQNSPPTLEKQASHLAVYLSPDQPFSPRMYCNLVKDRNRALFIPVSTTMPIT